MKFSGMCLLAVSLFTAASSFATTYTIKFGGSLGNVYAPNTLEAAVGDTIVWEGFFSAHPLQSDAVPNGADAFSNSTGNSFMYVLTAEGSYAYHCTIHKSLGMTGTITAATNGVTVPVSTHKTIMHPVTPNPANEIVMLTFDLANATPVTVTISSIDGKTVSVPVEAVPMGEGQQMVHIVTSSLATGTYLATMKGDGILLQQKFIVSR